MRKWLRLPLLAGLATAMAAGGTGLSGCGNVIDGPGAGAAAQRPLGFGDGVYVTKDPAVVLVPLDEGGYNPGGPCWVTYKFDATATAARTITITMTLASVGPPLPDGAYCAGAAVSGIYQRIHLPTDYHGQRLIDASNGHRVQVLHLSKLQLRGMHPPVG